MGIYKRKDSPFWWYCFTLNGHKVSGSTQTTDRKLAEQIYIAKRSEYQKIQYGFERQKTKLGDLFNDYIELYAKHSKRTYKSNVLVFARMKNFFGGILAHDLTSAKVEEYRVHRLSDGVSKSTVNREMALLKDTYNKGISWGKCSENPVTKIKFYSEKENRRTRYLDQQDKVDLLNACPLSTKRLVMTALLTGMRQGELLNMKWVDVDFNTSLIKVTHSKAGKPRYVNMNTELTNILKSIPTVSEYVFGTVKGKTGFTLYRKPFEKAVKNTGIQDFRFHDLRHCFASDLIMKGADIKSVSELLGHASTQMTERYSHLSKAHKQMIVELLPKGLFYYATATQTMGDPALNPNLRRNGLLAQLVEQATLNR